MIASLTAGLEQGETPLEGWILAVADAYETMTADRRFRPAIRPAAAQAKLERCSGRSSTGASSLRFCPLLQGAAERRGA